ncbi:unnamed protein product, partial [Aphanomyces euteiches]
MQAQAKPRRPRLSKEEKEAIRLHYRANGHMSQHHLAKWAMETFGLPCPQAQSTVVSILKTPPPADLAPKRLSSHNGFYPEVEAELMEWISKAERFKVPVVTGEMLRFKADQIRTRILASRNSSACQDQRLASAQFSKGWLYRFQQRHNLKMRHLHGEAASTNDAVVKAGRQRLHEVTMNYSKENMLNMDETA